MFFRTSAVLVLASLSIVACGGAAANAPAGSSMTAGEISSLDGKSFEVVLAFPGEADVKDTLAFANGKFESTACTPLGFPQHTAYDARRTGDALEFHVVARHPSGTIMDWKGTVKGGSVEGTATRTMNGQTVTAPFKGAAKG